MRYTTLDGIGKILAEDVELFSLLNQKHREPWLTGWLRSQNGIMCSASLVTILSKDYNLDSYILKCPVLNQEAPELHDEYRKKAEFSLNPGLARFTVQSGECSPNISGTILNVSYPFKQVHFRWTKIERLFSRLKECFKRK